MKSGWTAKPFEDCLAKVPSTTKVQRKDFLVSGEIPIISQEDGLINGYWNEWADAFRVTNPVTIFGDHTRALKYVDFDFVLGADGVKILEPKAFFDPKFFFYQLTSLDIPTLGYSRHYRLLKASVLSIPPLEEQRRIVTVLDEAFDAIATATANAEKNLANARELFEAAFRERFDHVGNGWQTYNLPQIAENWDYLRRPVTKSDRVPGDVPYYGASGQVDSVRDHLFDDDLLLISEDGANLLMRTYPIAFSISGKSWVNNHAHILKFDDMATQRLVEYYLNSISLAPWVSGMAQPKLNQKALNSIPVPLPPKSEREKLVGELDDLADCIERLEANQEQRLATLVSLKQSLLHRAFTGELTATAPDLVPA